MIYSIYTESDGKNKVEMSEEIAQATMKLRSFMFERVYTQKALKDEEERASRMITALYEYYTKNPDKLPELFTARLEIDGIDTVLCDYISGMSDSYVVKTFNEIFVPKKWKL